MAAVLPAKTPWRDGAEPDTLREMRSWEQIKQDELADMFPSYDVWFVPRVCGHTLWCARPKGHPVATIQAGSADELQERIAREIADVG
jgi:hypothetical protein